ncbi:TPA: hypothetical protein R8G72_002397 [Citrobacter youngae]|uniref:Uncharacterized protein n=1 Tax=Salmonella enterica TaxID=28901 RepID=A0A744JKK5_SALER|nr:MULTISPECIES: hypothetical protein [Enterobacteriaceae]EKL5341308.1 hypothetical protein [Salmonella enterica]HBM0089762.1 hypothetical protein [Salmonella enterica subsp. enterica serovar Tilburg]HEE0141930.1 hypothetical protein [Citrobacter youngae]EKR8719591.1 hypothetical protein [Salmonella enterica]MBJ9557976.1 hypothetical protein [Citrobacter sp. FDAARGOS_156]
MLTEFHFDEFYLGSDELDSDNAIFIHKKIIDSWKDFGCFVYPNMKKTDYIEWINGLDPKISQLWQVAFSHYKKSSMVSTYTPICDFQNPVDIEATYRADELDLIIIPNNSPLINTPLITAHNLEISKTIGIIDSLSFANSKSLCETDIADGDSIDDILEKRFKKLIKNSKVITIIDRYWAKNHDEDISRRKPALEKILDYIYFLKKNISIVIYTSNVNSPDNYNTILTNYVNFTLKRSANFSKYITYFEISVCDDNLFQPKGHDRYIAFDDKVCILGRGISIFRAYPVQNCTLNIKDINQTQFNKILKEFSRNRKFKI